MQSIEIRDMEVQYMSRLNRELKQAKWEIHRQLHQQKMQSTFYLRKGFQRTTKKSLENHEIIYRKEI